MARKLTDIIRKNDYLCTLPHEIACAKVYEVLANCIKEFEVMRLADYQQQRLVSYYKMDITSTRDFYVSKNEIPGKTKCWNLIKLIEVTQKETIADHHTEKWTTIRDFWYRVHRRSLAKGNSDVEKVLDPLARLCGFINLFDLLNNKFRDEAPFIQDIIILSVTPQLTGHSAC